MPESIADEEDDEIYKNLPDFKYDDTLKKLENANKELQDRIRHLEKQWHETAEENLKLKEENRQLHENISSLLKTANNELKRKDRVIEELRKENNQLIFRRKKISHKTEVECQQHTDDTRVHQKQELAHNYSNVQWHEEELHLISGTSNRVTDIVEDARDILKADNNLPDTNTCSSSVNNELNDVSNLGGDSSASSEILPVDSIQDDYSTWKARKNVVETVFSARMRKRLNASTEKNKKEIFDSTNNKQLCVSGSHDEKINSNKVENRPNDEAVRHSNLQELEATKTVKGAAQNEKKSITAGSVVDELESNPSGSVEFHSVDAKQDHHCSTNIQKNVVESVFSARMRKRLNASTENNKKEIYASTNNKLVCVSGSHAVKINCSKDEKHPNNEIAKHNNLQEFDATETVKEPTQNEEQSVNAGNVVGEIGSNSSGSLEFDSVDSKLDHHCSTNIQKNVVKAVSSEQMRKQLNASAEKVGKEIVVCTGTKQSYDSTIDEAKISNSKEERETKNDTAGLNTLQKSETTEFEKEETQNERKSVNAGNVIDELESSTSGSVEFHSVEAKQGHHCTTDVQNNVIEAVFSEQRKNQLHVSAEKNDKEIPVCTGTEQSYHSRIGELKINSSKEERDINNEIARHNILQELDASDVVKEATQSERKSVNAGNIIGELGSKSSQSEELHSEDAEQAHNSTTKVQKNVFGTVFTEQVRKQLNTSTEKDDKDIFVYTGTKQSCASKIDEVKINNSKEERETDETSRHNACQVLGAKEMEVVATQKERDSVNASNIIGKLESDSSGAIELHLVDAKQDYYCTTNGQKNVAETVCSRQLRKKFSASIEVECNDILVCTGAKQPCDSRNCNVKVNSSKKERDENDDSSVHNTHKKLEHIENLKEVSRNERTFLNADSVSRELSSYQSVEFQFAGAKQDHNCTPEVQYEGTEMVPIMQLKKHLNASKEKDDQETLTYARTKQPDGSRSHDDNIIVSEWEGDINDATDKHETVQKFENTTDVKEVALNERKFADAINILEETSFGNPDLDNGSKDSRPEHVNARTSPNEQCSYSFHSKKYHSHVSDIGSHNPAIQNCHRSSSQSSSTKSSSVDSCVIQSEERENAQKSSLRESTKHAKQDVKTNYHIRGKQMELRPKTSPSVRVANSVKSKYSRSRSKTPFDSSRFKIPKLSSKQRVRVERSSVLEQIDSESDGARTRYSRQYSAHNSHKSYTSYSSHSRVRQSFRDSQHYTDHRKYKHRDSSPVRGRSSSRSRHERRHGSAKFRDKDKRHIATRHQNVSKRSDSSRMETANDLLKKKMYIVEAEKVIHSQKQSRNVDFSLDDYRREIVTGKSGTTSSILGDDKHCKHSQIIPEYRKVTAENYNERKTQRMETEDLNTSKGYEYKLKKITFENKECRKPVLDLCRRLVSNSSSKLDKIPDTPELFHAATNEPNPLWSSDSALRPPEEQRKENIVPTSDAHSVTSQASNDTEGKLKRVCNSAVFKTDGVSVSIFRETCDFSTSRKRKSVVIRSKRTSGSCDVDSPEEKRQRLNNNDKIIVGTTTASVRTVLDGTVTKSEQTVVEKTASVETNVISPVQSFIGESRTERVQNISCTTDKQHTSVNDLGKLDHKLDLEDVKTHKEKASNTALHSEHVSEIKNPVSVCNNSTTVSAPSLNVESSVAGKVGCILQDVPLSKVSANEEGLLCSMKDFADHHELRFRKLVSERKSRRETRIEDMREELEEGEILDGSPVKTAPAVSKFSEPVHNMTSEPSCHRNINPISCSKPSLGDHLLAKERQHDTYERQEIADFETSNRYKVLEKFQNNDYEESGGAKKQSSQCTKAREVKDSVTVNKKTEDIESVLLGAKFEKESCGTNNITCNADNKDFFEKRELVNHEVTDSVISSEVSKSVCLCSNACQCTESNKQSDNRSDGNEMKCKGEVQSSSNPKSLKDGFSLCDKEATVSEDVNFSLLVEPEEICKQIDERKSDKKNETVKTKLASSCIQALSRGDTVMKDVDVSNRQKPEIDNSLVSGISVHKDTQPKSYQKLHSESNKNTSEASKHTSVQDTGAPLSSKLVSPPRRKKNARMTISTSQSSLQSEILMANLLQTHSPYKVGIHDEFVPLSTKYSEEIASGASCDNDNESLNCNSSKSAINMQSGDKHNSKSQRITRSKTTRLSSPGCRPDERNCNSKKSLKSSKKKLQKLMNFENEQIKLEEGSCRMRPQLCQSGLQDTDLICSYIAVDDLNVSTHLGNETTCVHTFGELKSGNFQVENDNRKGEAGLQEISEGTINQRRQTLGKDSMEMAADGYAEGRGGKEPLSGEELLKILEGSFENECGESKNVAKESDSLQLENAVMSCPQQSEIITSTNLPSATNKKNIIVRRRSRKCILEEAPMKFITIKPRDDTSPSGLIGSSVAITADEPHTNNSSPVCVTPSVPLCLQHDDNSSSSSSSSDNLVNAVSIVKDLCIISLIL
ncbi:uncharacterized protein LOC124545718 [Schistocerca americana]|uniref:uncharacterized protein LOC124545718 n=1 Tax=Schistocerca americana TaxID=7009 RepID=UPI001F502E6F|nr:uncharacterized protein LOC124545718 [Schistocerca americana]